MNGEEGMTDLVRVRYNLSLQKHPELFEKDAELFKKHQGLFASFSVGFLFFNVHVGVSLHTYGGISPRIYTRKPTRTYASGYTYVRISLHVYMSLCQAPSLN